MNESDPGTDPGAGGEAGQQPVTRGTAGLVPLRRVCLALLTAVSAYVGGWAYAAPRAWYDGFPGLGLRWLPQLGPYNQHLAKDTGALYIALAVLSAVALVRARDTGLVRLTGGVLLTYNTLHFAYHMTMLGMYGALDRALNIVTLGLLVLASAVLLLPARRAAAPARPRRA